MKRFIHIRYFIITFIAFFIFFPWLHNVAAAPPIDQLNNPGFEQSWVTPNKAYDWQDFGSGYTRLPRAGHSGQWGIQMMNLPFGGPGAQSGAYQRVDFNQTVERPIYIGGYVKGVNIKNDPGGFFGASIYAEIHLKDGSVVYWNSVPNFGTFDWRWVGFNTGTLPHVNQPIDYIFVVPFLANATGIAYFDDITVTEYQPSQSAVTLMFDDGNDTDNTIAKPLMDSYGYIGTTAIVTDNVGGQGFMTWNQIRELRDAGWEIASHTVSHSDLTTLPYAQMIKELTLSKVLLQSQGFIVKNIALPFGAFNGMILGEGSKYYRSVRRYEQGNNVQGVHPTATKVRGLLDTTTKAEVKSWLDAAQANGEWVVLVSHEIRETGPDPFHVTPNQFKDILEAVNESGLDVITYDEGLNRFAVSP